MHMIQDEILWMKDCGKHLNGLKFCKDNFVNITNFNCDVLLKSAMKTNNKCLDTMERGSFRQKTLQYCYVWCLTKNRL